jgi:hypothetical protein
VSVGEPPVELSESQQRGLELIKETGGLHQSEFWKNLMSHHVLEIGSAEKNSRRKLNKEIVYSTAVTKYNNQFSIDSHKNL